MSAQIKLGGRKGGFYLTVSKTEQKRKVLKHWRQIDGRNKRSGDEESDATAGQNVASRQRRNGDAS